jgi:hypothetical protein
MPEICNNDNFMKGLILVIACIFFSISCTQLKYLERFNGYKGKPKIVESTTYRDLGKGDSAGEKASYRNVIYFDRKGRIVKDLVYKQHGSLSNAGWNYVYDKWGNMLQNTLYNLDSSINVRNNYSYNEFGQQIRREYILGKTNSITKTEYDRKRRTAVIEGYTNDTVFHEKTIITYDDKWRQIELKIFKENGELERRIEKAYDQNGNMILSKWYDFANRLYEFYKIDFDNRNNRTGIENYRVKLNDTTLVNTSRIKYEYDEKGNIIYEGSISNGRATSVKRTRFHYW